MDNEKYVNQILSNQIIIMEALHRLLTPKCAGSNDIARRNTKTNVALIDAIKDTENILKI